MSGWLFFFCFGLLFALSIHLFKQRGKRTLMLGYGGAMIYVGILLISVPLFYFLPKEMIWDREAHSSELGQRYQQMQVDFIKDEGGLDSTFLVNEQSFAPQGETVNINDNQGDRYIGAQYVITKDDAINSIEVREYQHVSFDGNPQLKSSYLPALTVHYSQEELTISASDEELHYVRLDNDLYTTQYQSTKSENDLFISYSSFGMGYGESFFDIRVPATMDIDVPNSSRFIIKEAQ